MKVNQKISFEELKAKGIKQPPADYNCEICGRRTLNKVLSLVNGFWVCSYVECSEKAKMREGDVKELEEMPHQ